MGEGELFLFAPAALISTAHYAYFVQILSGCNSLFTVFEDIMDLPISAGQQVGT
jgi:hypothetical protein